MSGEILEFPLTGGVHQHIDARKLPALRMLSLQNTRIAKAGRYDKRWGMASVPLTPATTQTNPTAIAVPYTLAAHKSERLIVESGRIFTDITAKSTWLYVDDVPDWTARERPISQFNGTNYNADMAISADGKLACYAWVADYSVINGDVTKIWTVVENLETGATIMGPTQLMASANIDSPRVLWVGSSFIVVWANAPANSIVAARLLTSGALPWTWGANTTLKSDMASTFNGPFDAIVNGANFTFAYQSTTAAPNNVSFVTLSESFGAVASSLNNASGFAGALFSISILLVGSTLWFAYGGVNPTLPQIAAGTRNASTLASVTAPFGVASETITPLQICISDIGGGNAFVSWGQFVTGSQFLKFQAITTTAVTGALRVFPNMVLQSRPYMRSNKIYALIATQQPNLQIGDVYEGSISLAEITFAFLRPVCTWSPRTAPDGGGRSACPPASMMLDGSGKLRTVAPQTTIALVGQDSGVTPRLVWWDLAFDPDQTQRKAVELGGLTYLSGGMPAWYDGICVAEASFLQYPHATITSNTSAGGLTSGATYQYAIAYKHTDDEGNVHRSAPFIVSKTLGGSDKRCVLTISYLTLTARQKPQFSKQTQSVTIEIYRTTANGSQFFRLTADNDAASGVTSSSAGTMRNDQFSATFTYTDQAADGVLSNQPLLYTTGGVLEDVNPPSARLVCTHRGRIMLAGTPDGKTIWASKQQLLGEAPGFSEGLTLYIDEGDDVTAIASFDDKFIAWKSDRIFFFSGQGPDARGQNSDWSDPIRIASTVGAISPHILVTPFGAIFQSTIGLSLLGRDLSVNASWGAPVEDELAAFPVVMYMYMHPSAPEIRIGVAVAGAVASGTPQGKELRYDYHADTWMPATFLDGGAATFGAPMTAAVLGGVPYIGFSGTGTLYSETQADWRDAGTYYTPTVLEFAPVATAGVQGYQEFRSMVFIGDRYTDHDLTAQIAYDDAGYTDSKIITAALSATWPAYQAEISPQSSNKCERFKVKISDAFNAGTIGTGRGFALSSIGFDVEPKEGPNRRLPAAQRL